MILISPYSRPLRNGQRNAKNYPFWPALLSRLPGPIVQIGVVDEVPLVPDFRTLPLAGVRELLCQCDYWIAVDNFLQHLAYLEQKPGVVLWSKSDPAIFGHAENLNLLRSERYLRARQFGFWEEERFEPEAFVPADQAAEAITRWWAEHQENVQVLAHN